MPNEVTIKPLNVDPVGFGAEPQSPRQFAGSLTDRSVADLEGLLQNLEAEVAHPTARSQARRELDEVVWELERRETDRRTQQRRQANLNDLRDRNAQPVTTAEPGVWVGGRPLDDRERADLATFVRWVVRGDSA